MIAIMHQPRICKIVAFHTLFSVFFYSCNCSSIIKMDLTVNTDYLTLSCIVTERNLNKKIYLSCPWVKEPFNCLENCVDPNQVRNINNCRDQGENKESGEYKIDYIIDGKLPKNQGKWFCQYGGNSSSPVNVNASSYKFNVPIKSYLPTKPPPQDVKTKSETNIELQQGSVKEIGNVRKQAKTNNDIMEDINPYESILTRREFILTVIGLLVISVLFNLFFCCRKIITQYQLKKKEDASDKYFSMNHHSPPYNHSNSQVSDPDRIYEDTSMKPRQMSFLSQIKNGNGNYLAPRTFSPSSGLSTMLPQVPFNHSVSCSGIRSDSGSQNFNYHFVSDPTQAGYASVSFPAENSYTNFVTVPHEVCRRDGSVMTQPVYLAFQPGGPAGARAVHYDSQSLQNVPLTPTENQAQPSAVSQSKSTLNIQEDGKSNYQLSREMMEEADTLLRTADTLLRSTEGELAYYRH